MAHSPVAPAQVPATGTLETALSHAAGLLAERPDIAHAQALEILRALPGHPQARLVEARALRRMGKGRAARAILGDLAATQPRAALVFLELGQVCRELGEPVQAEAAFRRAGDLRPDLCAAWSGLAAALRDQGTGRTREAEAGQADLAAVRAATRDPDLVKAALALGEGHFEAAQKLLHDFLRRDPENAAAIRMMGELAWRIGRLDDAVALLERAISLAPGFEAARDLLARVLGQANRLPEALAQADELIARNPLSPAHAMLKASFLVRTGEQHGAKAIYEALLERREDQPRIWMNLGHVCKTIGRRDDAIAAYRRAGRLAPSLGEAWWSLANLKTVRLGAEDLAAMRAALAGLEGEQAQGEDAVHLHFALGKALEDAGADAEAFGHYETGNRLRAAREPFGAAEAHRHARDHAATFTAPFLAGRGEGGCLAADPIFVVGLPRAGSTLVEQILASHSMVEGTMELPDLMMIAARLESRIEEGEFADYGALMASLSPADRTRLGEEYIERTRAHRQSGKPHFIDKMPNNWQHLGLIRLILPNARIVDARRHPLGCCFSGWKQHFARGQDFTYDLAGIGAYYRDYTAQMAAFEQVAPGAVHRVIYERMVADTPGEVARLLGHLGLPFEDACLAFWQTERAVRTASSEQVRQPIFTDAVEHWKRFEPWLGDLVSALGPVLAAYPDAPDEWRERLA